MARWEVMLFRKKGVRLGVIDAREERKATAKAAETFNGHRRFPSPVFFGTIHRSDHWFAEGRNWP